MIPIDTTCTFGNGRMADADDRAREFDARATNFTAAMHPFRSLIVLTSGSIALCYGHRINYLLLFARVFRRHGYPLLRRVTFAVQDSLASMRDLWSSNLPRFRQAQIAAQDAIHRLQTLREAYSRAQETGDVHEAAVLEAELAELENDARRVGLVVDSLQALVAAIDLQRLQAFARDVQQGCATLAYAATSNGAAMVGIDRNIGDECARRVRALLAPRLREALHHARAHSDLLDRMHRDAAGMRWLDYIVQAACQSLGLGIAFYVEGAVFTVANAKWGAETVISTLLAPLRIETERQRTPDSQPISARRPMMKRAHSFAVWLLTACGCYYQLRSGRRMSAPLAVVLFAPLVMERYARAITFAARATPGPLTE